MYNYYQTSNSGGLETRHGQYFNYAVPSGWRVVEEGQFAVVLLCPDNSALTLMVGNSGLPVNYNPWQFVYDKLTSLKPNALQIGQPRQAQPISGYTVAYEFDYTYTVNNVPCQGLAKCSIAYSYNICNMVVTSAASHQSQWGSYASWLPRVAEQFTVTNMGAFGISGTRQQSRDIAIAEGQQAREYREWQQRTWGEVTRQRHESIDRQNYQFRENLGNTRSWTNPYGYPVAELPTSYQYYWINRQGQIYGTNNPTENPNYGSTQDWARMNRYQPY